MKTERNGILETFWRKFVSFVNTPLFDFLYFSFLLFFAFLAVVFAIVFFPSVASLLLAFEAGVCFVCFSLTFISFIYFLSHCKSSAEADKTN